MAREHVTELLQAISIHMPEDTHLPKSKYLLEKSLQVDNGCYTKKYYCPECKVITTYLQNMSTVKYLMLVC